MANTLSLQTFVLMKASWRRLLSSPSEDVLKTSSRCLDQDEYIRPSHTSSEGVLKTSSSRLDQDQYIGLGHASSRRLQGVFKTFCRTSLKTASRHLQDVFKDALQKCLQDVFKTFWIRLAKMPLRRFKDITKLNCFPRSRICLGRTSEKFMVRAENLQVW